MNPKINQQPNTGVRLDMKQSATRQTQDTSFQKTMGEGLKRGANAVLSGAGLAAPFFPGAAVVSAAVHNAGAITQQVGGQSGGGGAFAGNSTGLVGGTTMSSAQGVGGAGSVQQLAAGGDKDAVMMVETNRMQELNRTFSLQYLNLQQKMQEENRSFSTMSNVIKTKHDTAKAVINNVR